MPLRTPRRGNRHGCPFTRERRTALEQRVAALRRAMEVPDEEIAYYG
ncbi:hypothetical protein [Streptomyces sp. BE230]|nr:hypothetical protein [Streptomyces sp. BE230]